MNKLLTLMRQNDVDATFIVPGPNMLYFTGLKIKQSERVTFIVILRNGEIHSLVPEVEQDKFKAVFENNVISYKDEEGIEGALQQLKAVLPQEDFRASVEYSNCRVTEYRVFRSLGCELTDADHLINALRLIKEDQEIAELQNAAKVLEDSFKATLPFIKTGVPEVEIAAQLEYEMKKRGSAGTPFETIVASGPRGASPHGRAGAKKIAAGELVVIDFGCIIDGYVGDICRTVAVGNISDEARKAYKIVKEAQQHAVNLIKPGIPAGEIDEAARSIIRSHGYGAYFNHRTGHGLGINPHEEPYIMQGNKQVLEPGMVFSVEPGIYMPNKFGIRIEDTIAVTEDGHINLMNLEKDLIEI
ncbi:aminopeptidase P family protein [Salinicoccus sp. ID82-1]|uniref:M24 family metallopeptidase n=1 Tax=Salinicoccus sp. ID82-1 TaxID=2820269 RepID=UPI001F306FE7|nr:Xaa-Pro peptidase family protein [Salinicoccus sp. ID82-1]MCG1009705.1 aminopeptidase P family protein [Salinicoccus sp. ID82-1]